MSKLLGITAVVVLAMVATTAVATPIIVDDGGAGFSRSGDGFYGPSAGFGYLNDYQWANYVSSNPAQATWQFSGLASQTWDVYTTWSLRNSWDNNADFAPFTIFDGTTGGSTLLSVVVNQDIAPVGIAYDGATWFKLGTVTVTGSQLAVQLRATATMEGTAIADGVMIDVPEPATLVMLGMGGVAVLLKRNRKA